MGNWGGEDTQLSAGTLGCSGERGFRLSPNSNTAERAG